MTEAQYTEMLRQIDEQAEAVAKLKDRVLRAMQVAGYEYDPIDSDDDWLVFNGDAWHNRIHFPSWEDAEDWLCYVVIDDPELDDKIWRIIHEEV